ncbi:MAG: helix-turn-helix transcriptional regulator [Lentisphaerae bacterium]|jgi:transcriptional regulator with XRE-family HTH domain|nr:helix-turn-helix transcriptional regulator [Lentisphaerota bacterium]
MSKPISELRKGMSKERLERIAKKTEALKKEMALQELRQALNMTQAELAEKLHVNQAAVSKYENQSDLYISTLRRILSSMGGELRITAHFAEGDVVINQFHDANLEPA